MINTANFLKYIILTLYIFFIAGCELKSRGEIVFEYHKNGKEAYLVNNSSSEIISFTVRKQERTFTDTIFFPEMEEIKKLIPKPIV